MGQLFKMKDLGNLKYILGVEVKRDRANRILELHQHGYHERILERAGMSSCKPMGSPMEASPSRLPDGEGGPDREYRQRLGELMYSVGMTRPDLAHAVQALARQCMAVGDDHWTALKHLLRYLQGTKDKGIKYGGAHISRKAMVTLYGYSDADWGGDPDTRRSTTGYVFMLAGAIISWNSKLQPTVALSSAEAEYMAACACVQEAIYLRQLLGDLGYEQEEPTIIYEDNQGCIALAQNPIMHKRSKHIAIKHHFVRERIAMGEVELHYVPTEHQLADLLTKPLGAHRVKLLRSLLMGDSL
jgi:hypothetical protein